MIIDLMSDSGQRTDQLFFGYLSVVVTTARQNPPKSDDSALGSIDRRNQERPYCIHDLAQVARDQLHSGPRQLWHSKKCKLNRTNHPYCACAENGWSTE